MSGTAGRQRRHLAAVVAGLCAARREGAACGQLADRRHGALDGRQPARARGQPRARGQQPLGVGVGGPVEDVQGRAVLDDAPGVHHRHAVAHLGDYAQVVRDQQHGHAFVALDAAQQLEDLRLDGHVQRGGRLVGHQQPRATGQRHGDHHALAHAARELVRVAVELARRVGHLHALEQLQRLGARRRALQPTVPAQHLTDLLADAHHRVQRAHRLLEDHRHLAAAQRAPLRLGQGEQVALAPPGLPAPHRHRRRQQAHQRQRQHALARARLADHAQHLARREVEVHPVQDQRPGPADAGVEAADAQQRRGGCRAHRAFTRMRGSSTSRRPSPSRFRPSTLTSTVSPGATVIHGAATMKSRPLAMMAPKVGVGGGGPTPM